MGSEKDSDFYDEVYLRGGVNSKYLLESSEVTIYYEIWKVASDYIHNNNITTVIDFGCGPGHFSTLINDIESYVGYDFSKVAIKQAINRNLYNPSCKFIELNLNNYCHKKQDIFYTAFEFFEHVECDLDLIEGLSIGNEILFSVPNHDSEGHVRFFESIHHIKNRYSSFLKLSHLHTVEYGNKKKIFLVHGKRI